MIGYILVGALLVMVISVNYSLGYFFKIRESDKGLRCLVSLMGTTFSLSGIYFVGLVFKLF
jgi:hypothetical protein